MYGHDNSICQCQNVIQLCCTVQLVESHMTASLPEVRSTPGTLVNDKLNMLQKHVSYWWQTQS